MKDISLPNFYFKKLDKKHFYPLHGQIELTYRCALNCFHCYCKGSENRELEFETGEWKKIIAEIQRAGCICLCLTGGDPFVRKDFLEIYSYIKAKGFIITIFTNASGLTNEILAYLIKSPPLSIEVTLNGATPKSYEAVTQVRGSFLRVMNNIKRLAKNRLPLTLKSNCLKINNREIGTIKKFSEELLGKLKNTHRFGYDPMIYPRLNGDKTPCEYRLSFEELLDTKRRDRGIWEEYQYGLHSSLPLSARDNSFTYHCNSWMKHFFINPYGRLKFCEFSEKFSVDIRTTSFREWFYGLPKKIFSEKFKTGSPCRDCGLRSICYYCPARSYLETGNEEGPVPYYCELANGLAKEIERVHAAK